MKGWNVVVSIYQDGFKRALRALREFGPVERSPYYNVLVMKVEDPMVLLESVERRTEENPALYDAISRVAPAMRGFEFQSAEEFEAKAKSIMLEWSSRLAGRSFHVRLHRRAAQHAFANAGYGAAPRRRAPRRNEGDGQAGQNIVHRSGCGHCDRHD